MDKQMMLAATINDLTVEGLRTTRRKNDSLPKLYRWDEAGQLRAALDRILEYKQSQKLRSIYLFCNREGQPYLPLENGQMFDLEGHAFGKPSGFNSLWQRSMDKWVEDGHERFTEHDLRKVPASATDTSHAQQLLDHHSPKMTKEVYQVGTKVVDIQPNPDGK
jgi:integrase